ncbi:MAG: hypothetical protein MUO53_16540, partial [Maribacter sp.]|nr:hypothetical protein [Maribacter sp.]
MIKLFRNIRLRLLTQASSDEGPHNLPNEGLPALPAGRYLKYASGGFVLCSVRNNPWVAIRIKANPRAFRYDL